MSWLTSLALVAPFVPDLQEPAVAPATTLEERLEAELVRLVDDRGLPGASAAIVLADGTLVAAAAGLASREEARALTTDDRLLSGSVGKSWVAATAIGLVLEGKLDLDAAVAPFFEGEEWYPRLPNRGRFTVRQLLRHETGLERYEMMPEFWRAALAEPDRVWEREEQLAFVLDRDALFPPGEGWGYADTNYVLLGLVLESVLGGPIEYHVRERFLEPHGLSRTAPSDARVVPGLVQGYAVSTRAMGMPERMLDADGRYAINPQFEWCGGGYAGTPSDLARWAWVFYGGRAFDGDYLPLLLDAVEARELGPGRSYGLGVIVTETPLGELRGHDGFMPGYLTSMGVFAETGVAVAFQTNTDDGRALGAPLHAVLVRLARLAAE